MKCSNCGKECYAVSNNSWSSEAVSNCCRFPIITKEEKKVMRITEEQAIEMIICNYENKPDEADILMVLTEWKKRGYVENTKLGLIDIEFNAFMENPKKFPYQRTIHLVMGMREKILRLMMEAGE